MSGEQTAALAITGCLIMWALGFSVASCVDQDRRPLLPAPAATAEPPLTLAKTRRVRTDVFSTDEKYRLATRCSTQGLRPEVTDHWVACNGRGRLGWFEGVSDVATWERQ